MYRLSRTACVVSARLGQNVVADMSRSMTVGRHSNKCPIPSLSHSCGYIPFCRRDNTVQSETVCFLHNSASLMGGKPKNTKKKRVTKIAFPKKKSIKRSWDVIGIRQNMTIEEVAQAMDKDVDHVFETLFYIPDTDDYDTPKSVIRDFNVIKAVLDKSGYRWKIAEKPKEVIKENKDAFPRPPADLSDLVPRPPVVTIMGHVDHGKTTLLDTLRDSNIVAGEFGGITQHIGAFSVTLSSGHIITFLDTPGHAAFSSMRARGAFVTDVVILVVAADDGVMQQTLESLKHAQAANVPVIIAINKIDKFDADVDRTKQMLLQHGVNLDEFGGDVLVVPISALKKTNLDMMQDAVIIVSELLELQADPTGLMEGVVIEARTDLGKGKVATVLVNRGTLQKSACLVAGNAWGKVRNCYDDQSKAIKEASPGMAVEVSGWKDLPSAGDMVLEVHTEARAKEVMRWRTEQDGLNKAQKDLDVIQQKQAAHKEEYQSLRQQMLDKGYRRAAIYGRQKTKEVIKSQTGPALSIVVKADVDGSLEALLDVLGTYDSDLCHLNILQYGVGIVSELDIDMAESFGGHVFAFNVDIPSKIEALAQQKNVHLHSYNIIYRFIETVRDLLNSNIPVSNEENIIGEAVVRQSFVVSQGKRDESRVAGCHCLNGMLLNDKRYKVLRNGETLHTGMLSSLRHFKDEVKCIKEAQECGLIFRDSLFEPQPGDTIYCYNLVKVQREIDWNF